MHPQGWLFPGQNATKPLSIRQLHRVVVEAAAAAGIAKRVDVTLAVASRTQTIGWFWYRLNPC